MGRPCTSVSNMGWSCALVPTILRPALCHTQLRTDGIWDFYLLFVVLSVNPAKALLPPPPSFLAEHDACAGLERTRVQRSCACVLPAGLHRQGDAHGHCLRHHPSQIYCSLMHSMLGRVKRVCCQASLLLGPYAPIRTMDASFRRLMLLLVKTFCSTTWVRSECPDTSKRTCPSLH